MRKPIANAIILVYNDLLYLQNFPELRQDGTCLCEITLKSTLFPNIIVPSHTHCLQHLLFCYLLSSKSNMLCSPITTDILSSCDVCSETRSSNIEVYWSFQEICQDILYLTLYDETSRAGSPIKLWLAFLCFQKVIFCHQAVGSCDHPIVSYQCPTTASLINF